MIPLREYPFAGKIMVVAHRGDSGHAPENTLASFRRAIECGADMVELDIQRTRDDRLVVFHDATLRRTTNGRGYIARKTYAQLAELDAGSWFDKKFAGEKVPLLDDVLSLLRGRIYIDIEIKPTAVRGATVPLLLQALRRFAMEPYVLISSFHHGVLKKIKRSAPHLATAIIQNPHASFRSPVVSARRAGADAIVCSIHQVSRARSEDARAHGMPICVYTVNTPRAVAKALRCNVSAVVTNYPAEIARLL
ncbi:MAG TPA: glycerophosphodiester phosphodiesterase family protein [Candidatus Kapabacteria bacterium]|nr:glycerophosphodiester phosphodiesterase family protein [Candidatus Kapabacteria bacterium]